MNVAIGPILAAIFAIAGLLGFNLSEEIQAQVVSAAALITNGVLGMIVAYGAIKAVQGKKVNDTAVRQAETTAKQADTTMRQAYTAAKQDYAGAKQAETATQQAEVAMKQDDTTVKHANTAARQTDTTAQQTDTTAKHADATARLADVKVKDEHADVNSQRGFIRLSSMVALAIIGALLAIVVAAGCASVSKGLTPDQRAAAVLVDAKHTANACGELFEAKLITQADGMGCLMMVSQAIEAAQTAHFIIVAGEKKDQGQALEAIDHAEKILASIEKVIVQLKAKGEKKVPQDTPYKGVSFPAARMVQA